MTLKEALLEELQKLRLSRERPPLLQSKSKVAKQKRSKLLEEAMALLKEED